MPTSPSVVLTPSDKIVDPRSPGSEDAQPTYAQCSIQYQCTVSLRKEAAVQGVTDQVKLGLHGCYDKKFLADGGADVENTYVDNLFLPFSTTRRRRTNPMLANFVHYTGKDNVDFAGASAWSAAIRMPATPSTRP